MSAKRLGVIVASMFMAMVWLHGTASAQLDLSWRNCVIAAPGEVDPVWNENFDCGQPTEYLLVASIRFPETREAIGGLYTTFYLESEAPGELAPFWRFEAFSTPGCNDGVTVATNIGELGRCGAASSMWYQVDAQLLFGMLFYPQQPNRARFDVIVSGAAAGYAGEHRYAFHLVIRTDRSSQCAGCNHPVAIVWDEALTVSGNESEPDLYLAGPGKVSPCASINGATATTCAATPTRSTTWGAIKALYR